MYYRMDKLLPIMLRKLPLSYTTVQWDRPCTQHNGQSWASSVTGRTWEHHVNILKNSCEHCENIRGTSWEHKSHNRCYQCISLPKFAKFCWSASSSMKTSIGLVSTFEHTRLGPHMGLFFFQFIPGRYWYWVLL